MIPMVFYVWVSVVSDRAVDRLVSGLVRRGMKVGPLATTGAICETGEASAFAALWVDVTPPAAPTTTNDARTSWLVDQTREVLNDNRDSYYSILCLTGATTCTWLGPNIKIPKKDAKEAETAKETREPTALDRMDSALEKA
jgi:hypothetical protein